MEVDAAHDAFVDQVRAELAELRGEQPVEVRPRATVPAVDSPERLEVDGVS